MNRKLIWFSILSIFFLAWGVSGFSVRSSHGAVLAQSMLSQADAPLTSQATEERIIPVTGEEPPGWEILILYGMIVLATLTLILTLLDSANQSTSRSARRNLHSQETRMQ